MDVFLLEVGSYDHASVVGVYSTVEKAMAAHQPAPTRRTAKRDGSYGQWAGMLWSFKWERQGEQWRFGADHDDAASITREVLDA